MISTADFQAIAELDLDPIKVKLMHKESGEGWSLEKVNSVEVDYRRFLYLMKMYPNEAAAPLMDVDIFWHYHILDTMKYAEDCDKVYGYFKHHFPYIGLRGDDDMDAHHAMGSRMQQLYEQTFDEPYFRDREPSLSKGQIGQDVAFSAVIPPSQKQMAFSAVIPPSQQQVAFSAVIPPSHKQVAFSAVIPPSQKQVAFSAVIPPSHKQVAFSAVIPPSHKQVAFSAVIPPSQKQVAFSAVIPPSQQQAAFSAVIPPSQHTLFTARPRLPSVNI